MATFEFENINAATALTLTAADRVTVAEGTAAETTVVFNADLTLSITIGSRTVIFGSGFNPSPTTSSRIIYPDTSILTIGNASNNTGSLAPTGTLRSGAVYGGAGDDTYQGNGSWLVQGNSGADLIDLQGGHNTVYGGQDNDRIRFTGGFSPSAGFNFAQGNKGDDQIEGNFNPDTLLGGQGNDTINGGDGGGDFINGNLGNDVLTGGGTLLGEGGDDTITNVLNQASTLNGGDGDDQITVRGGMGAVIFGGEGADNVTVGIGSDTVSGGGGNDTLTSPAGNAAAGDILNGDDGNDQLNARNGANVLRGGAGQDRLVGGSDADTLDGGLGADTLTGDAGADLFVLTSSTDPRLFSQDFDRILDWSSNDRLQLRVAGAPGYNEVTAIDLAAAISTANGQFAGGVVEVVSVQVGTDVIVFTDGGAGNTIDQAVILVGRTLADISSASFV